MRFVRLTTAHQRRARPTLGFARIFARVDCVRLL